MFKQSRKEQASSSFRTLWTLESGKDAGLASGHPMDHVMIPRETSIATTDRKTAGNKRQVPVPALGETKQTPEKKGSEKSTNVPPTPHVISPRYQRRQAVLKKDRGQSSSAG